MRTDIHIATPPSKPLMIFDGDCNFCILWIRRWQQITGESVDYLASQDPLVTSQFPEIPCEQFNTAVQLIEPDGVVYSGAEAVFRALAQNTNWRLPLQCYEKSRIFANIAEWAYYFVAKNRKFFSGLTRWFLGRCMKKIP